MNAGRCRLFVVALQLLAGTVLALDCSYPDPTDVRKILLEVAAVGNLNLIIGEGVEGLTTHVSRGRTAEQTLVDVARGAGFTIRKVDTVLAVRSKTISPGRIEQSPFGFIDPTATLSLRHVSPTPPRAIMLDACGQIGKPLRLHKHAKGRAIVAVYRANPRVFFNLFSEAMGLDWGTAGDCLVMAPYQRLEHYEIEMRVDQQLCSERSGRSSSARLEWIPWVRAR